MLWLNTSGRAPRTVASACSSTPRKSGVRSSTEHVRQLGLEGPRHGGEVARAAVRHVVAVDGGDDDVLQPHLRRRLREAERLERVGSVLRLARVHVAIAAGARAGVAEDLERRGALAPALGDVRAARLLADRVEARAVDQLLDVEVAAVGARRAHLHPLGAARAIGDGKRRLHEPKSTFAGTCDRAPSRSHARAGRYVALRAPPLRAPAARGRPRPRGGTCCTRAREAHRRRAGERRHSRHRTRVGEAVLRRSRRRRPRQCRRGRRPPLRARRATAPRAEGPPPRPAAAAAPSERRLQRQLARVLGRRSPRVGRPRLPRRRGGCRSRCPAFRARARLDATRLPSTCSPAGSSSAAS